VRCSCGEPYDWGKTVEKMRTELQSDKKQLFVGRPIDQDPCTHLLNLDIKDGEPGYKLQSVIRAALDTQGVEKKRAAINVAAAVYLNSFMFAEYHDGRHAYSHYPRKLALYAVENDCSIEVQDVRKVTAPCMLPAMGPH